MPAPTIEAIPVAVRPTSPMLRTNLALAKAGAGPEHRRDAQRKDALLLLLLHSSPRRSRRRAAAGPHPGAHRLPPACPLRDRARGADLVARREAAGLSVERPGACPERQVWVVDRDGSGLRRLTERAEPGWSLRGGVAPRTSGCSTSRPGEVRRISAAGGKARGRSRRRPATVASLPVSPDGRTAAWVQDGELWLLPLGGGAPVQATARRREARRQGRWRLRPTGRRARPQRLGRGARAGVVPGRPLPRAAVRRPPRRPPLPHPRLPHARADARPGPPRRPGGGQRPPDGGASSRSARGSSGCSSSRSPPAGTSSRSPSPREGSCWWTARPTTRSIARCILADPAQRAR